MGGRLPQGISLQRIQAERNPTSEYQAYDRSAFGRGWDDANGDCRNSRAEALIATSTTKVEFASDRECRVVRGQWISPFTGQLIHNSGDIDIDHVVPLAWSWERESMEWTREKREQFANYPVNLLPVEASLDKRKAAKGPDEWLPPSGQCGYVARFVRVVRMYGLKPAPKENAWLSGFLEGCRG